LTAERRTWSRPEWSSLQRLSGDAQGGNGCCADSRLVAGSAPRNALHAHEPTTTVPRCAKDGMMPRAVPPAIPGTCRSGRYGSDRWRLLLLGLIRLTSLSMRSACSAPKQSAIPHRRLPARKTGMGGGAGSPKVTGQQYDDPAGQRRHNPPPVVSAAIAPSPGYPTVSCFCFSPFGRWRARPDRKHP
jgi:hypothetical protein